MGRYVATDLDPAGGGFQWSEAMRYVVFPADSPEDLVVTGDPELAAYVAAALNAYEDANYDPERDLFYAALEGE